MDHDEPPPPYTADAVTPSRPNRVSGDDQNSQVDDGQRLNAPCSAKQGKLSKSPPPPADNLGPSPSGSGPPSPFSDPSRYGGPPQPPEITGQVARQFPPAFGLYSVDVFGREFVIGEHQDRPLYAVKVHSGLSSSPPLVLHNGPDPDACAMMASLEFHTLSSTIDMALPALPGAKGGGGGGSPVVALEAMLGWHRSYVFTIEVGLVGGEVRREAYEWRHSYGVAVEALRGDFDGYKLVRMERSPPPGMPAGARHEPGRFATSDGLEVVAVWSEARLSLTKQGKFAFVGTGETGLLGERWAVAAVMSALAIWRVQKRKRNNNAG